MKLSFPSKDKILHLGIHPESMGFGGWSWGYLCVDVSIQTQTKHRLDVLGKMFWCRVRGIFNRRHTTPSHACMFLTRFLTRK